jgi:hypothetical protein
MGGEGGADKGHAVPADGWEDVSEGVRECRGRAVRAFCHITLCTSGRFRAGQIIMFQKI